MIWANTVHRRKITYAEGEEILSERLVDRFYAIGGADINPRGYL